MSAQTELTAAMYCEQNNVKPDAVRMKLARAGVRGFSAQMILTPEHLAVLNGGRKRSITKVHVNPAVKVSTGTSINEARLMMTKSPAAVVKSPAGFNSKTIGMYGLMLMPLAVSIQNMHQINLEMSGMEVKALGMTGLFSILPAAFVVFNLRGLFAAIVTAALIGYEAFCNSVTVFNWLTGFGKGDTPIPFLWKVCEFTGTEQYGTARFLAVGFSLMVAAAFYAVVINLKKK